MMALRLCVQRHQRLPQELVVDCGAEFGSVYFDVSSLPILEKGEQFPRVICILALMCSHYKLAYNKK
jgi:hypothetical protein